MITELLVFGDRCVGLELAYVIDACSCIVLPVSLTTVNLTKSDNYGLCSLFRDRPVGLCELRCVYA